MPVLMLATAVQLPVPDAETPALVRALRARGIDALVRPWDDPEADWASAQAVVIRSPWDYFERRDEFVAWARAVERDTALFNPADVVEWNSHKRYLLDLAGAGVPIVATALVAKGATQQDQGRALAGHDGEVVIKPAIAGGAVGALRTAAGSAGAAAHLAGLAGRGDALVQPLVTSVLAEGETSLVYFGDRFSHAVRKVPAAGDFRVHQYYGGRLLGHVPSAAELDVAAAALARAPSPTAYGRVDLVRLDSGPAVMELEIIEPELFLRCSAPAVDRFADHLASLVR